jgi:hypothetical protein
VPTDAVFVVLEEGVHPARRLPMDEGCFRVLGVSLRRKIMSAATAAFLGSRHGADRKAVTVGVVKKLARHWIVSPFTRQVNDARARRKSAVAYCSPICQH